MTEYEGQKGGRSQGKWGTFNGAQIQRDADELAKRFQEISVELNSSVLQALEACGIKVEGSAAYNAPVDTGLLRKSITHVTTVESGVPTEYIGTNVEYAPYIEFGTGIYADNGQGRKTPWLWVDWKGEGHWTFGQEPTHFLSNALNSNKGFIDQRLKLAMKNKIDELGKRYRASKRGDKR